MNVLTAVGNTILASQLKNKGLDICAYDIQYKEGILEYMDINNDIDYLVMDYNLPGEIDIKDLVNNILEANPLIKIIIINYSDEEKIDGIYQSFKQNNVEDVVKFILMDSNVMFKENKAIKGKIVTVLGTSGVGKSVFSINLANVLNSNKKLIIDFDVLNNSLHYLLGVKDYTDKVQRNIRKNILEKTIKQASIQEKDQEYEIETNPIVLKTKFNVDLISGVNLIFDTKSQLNPLDIRKALLNLKSVYEVIIIDTSSNCFMEYNKEIMKISDELLFLSGASLYEVQKAQILLRKYTAEYKINKDKFYIVFNKCTRNSIDESILRELFKEYKVLGKIKLREYYDYIINKNRTKQRKIKREIKKIEKRGGFGGKSIREYTKSKYRYRKSKFGNRTKFVSKIDIGNGD